MATLEGMPEPPRQAARVVPAARAILIGPGGRILLFRWLDPESGHAVWFTPGGGLHPGESYVDAVRRELREEVGIEVADIGHLVWTRQHFLPRTKKPSLDLRERFYVVLTEDAIVDTSGFTSAEVESITEYRWMTPDEIAGLSEVVAPARLSELLWPVLRGEYPTEPIDAGV